MIIDSPTLRKNSFFNKQNEKFVFFCENGDVKSLKKLIIYSTIFKLPNILIYGKNNLLNIHNCYYYALKRACSYGQIKIVDFLLCNIFFKKYQKDISNKIEGFLEACYYNKKELVKFFIENKLFNFLDVEEGLISAASNESIDVVDYLVFVYDISLTPKIEKFIIDNNCHFLKKRFDTKQLYFSLNIQIKSRSKVDYKNIAKI